MFQGQRLKVVRNLRNLTQGELGEKTGIPNTYISMIETGRIIPADNWEEKLRAALNWTPELDAQIDALVDAPA